MLRPKTSPLSRMNEKSLSGMTRLAESSEGPPVIASIHAEGVFSLRYCSIVQVKTVGQTARCITLRLATNGPSVALPSLMIVGII